MRFAPLETFHMEQLAPQSAQQLGGKPQADVLAALIRGHTAVAALVDDRCVGAGGIVEKAPGRGHCWTIIGQDMPRHGWPALVRRIAQAVVDAQRDFHRLEAEVRAGWMPGHRLMTRLGFEFECLHRAALADGGHVAVYVRFDAPRSRPLLPVRYGACADLACRCYLEDVLGLRPSASARAA